MPRQHLSILGWLAAAVALTLTAVSDASLPSYQAVAPDQITLDNVRMPTISVPSEPFGLIYAKQMKIAFVSLNKEIEGSALGLLNTSTFAAELIHQITLALLYVSLEGGLGIGLTHDGRHVLIGAGPGLVVVDVARAVTGCDDAVVGSLNGTVGDATTGNYAIEVTITSHDEYAFVSQEYGAGLSDTTGNIDVIKLHKPIANGSVTGEAIGHLNLGCAVVGSALSPNGRFLYAVSETTTANDTTPGSFSVIDVEILKKTPSKALLHSVPAGCGLVRLLVSADGKIVWATARESNHLLAFNATKLQSPPRTADNALLASL
ncbi:hypothetical protein LTR85_005356 [Meristemomyces frigidus]|nr:hypothetical protein LTR85_005356 [Meristemomyces frigidus]